MRVSRLLVVTGTTAALLLPAVSASAAHNGNNRAELSGAGTGVALLNYSEGRGTFNGSTNVQGLEDGDYTFRVSLNGNNVREICSFTVGDGRSGCSATDLALPGFNRAEIVDSDGAVVASGVFARRGNCRDPQQGGSQCEAPGQNRS